LLRALAETGGVVGLNFHSRFLRRRGRASIEDVVAHATHMIDVMGAEHVAIGSDFDGSIAPPSDLRSHADLPALAAELARANIGADEITGIMGRNARDAIAAPSASTRCDGARESRRTRPSKTDRAR
jgi:membrane dipeptidase